MKDFKKLLIWQKSIEIVKSIYILAKDLPDSEKYGLISQLTRASVSVPANIAEGSSRTSEKDYKRFLEIALGSLYELETLLFLILELDFQPIEKVNNIIASVKEEQKMIIGFIKKLNY